MKTIQRAVLGLAALSLAITSGCSVHLGGSRHPRTARDTVVVTQPAPVGGGPVIVDGHHHRHHHHDTVVVDD